MLHSLFKFKLWLEKRIQKLRLQKRLKHKILQLLHTVETPDTSSIKESSQKPEKKDKTKEKDEIPEFVKELLQKYPGYPALYIDSKGGVFTADAQPNWVKDAILYQNPYYKQ